MQSLIVAAMKRNDVPSVPPSKKMKSEIRSAELMNSAEIDDAKTLVPGEADATKLMEYIVDMSLKISNGKPVKTIRLV